LNVLSPILQEDSEEEDDEESYFLCPWYIVPRKH
jgi:hypothetical protein